MPPKIWVIGIRSPTTDFTTNTFNPTGGVSRPISMYLIRMIPIQIRSMSACLNTGIRIGSVISRMPSGSRNIPRIR